MIELQGNEPLIRWAVTLFFSIASGVGGYVVRFKQMRQDVNGIGKRTKNFEKNATLAIMACCPEGKRTEIAELLKQDS